MVCINNNKKYNKQKKIRRKRKEEDLIEKFIQTKERCLGNRSIC